MDNFNVSRQDKAEVSVLYLEGFLDAHTATELEDQMQALLNDSRFRILVNFEKLNYISSAGLGVFMGFIEQVREHDGDIKMCCMPPKIYRVFDLLGFPTLYDIVDMEEQGIERFFKPKSDNIVKEDKP